MFLLSLVCVGFFLLASLCFFGLLGPSCRCHLRWWCVDSGLFLLLVLGSPGAWRMAHSSLHVFREWKRQVTWGLKNTMWLLVPSAMVRFRKTALSRLICAPLASTSLLMWNYPWLVSNPTVPGWILLLWGFSLLVEFILEPD